MATFVLIHGAAHGAWCWHKVEARLRAAGHEVVVPDLPGHGADTTPIGALTATSYRDRICEVLDGETEPVVLVGHSLGGLVISIGAEERASKISKLVYLTAVLPGPGVTFAELAIGSPEVMVALRPNADGASMEFASDAVEGIFYAGCSPEDVSFAKSKLCPQPAAPIALAPELTADQFGRIPRFYIECLQDRALLPEQQKHMVEKSPCVDVYSLDTDHSPFFSAPDRLCEILEEIAERP